MNGTKRRRKKKKRATTNVAEIKTRTPSTDVSFPPDQVNRHHSKSDFCCRANYIQRNNEACCESRRRAFTNDVNESASLWLVLRNGGKRGFPVKDGRV
ncbi:hypothetical protein E2C01_060881 [Portunus trituberculatus]|uniref:Uncharacterized protein n=1 Tax=Portunus trituberculatus TaxID=210409 RepID=A0A5B7HA90_PORTR|nr:hypothetical protein [Portunus trituberculatus]